MDLTDSEIFSKLKEIAHRLLKLQQEVLSGTNVGVSYYKILKALSFQDGLNQTCISEICQIDKPATSRLLEKMRVENLIEKTSKQGNKKNIYIKLTEFGRKTAKELSQKAERLKSKYFKDLAQKDKVVFLALLNKI